MFDIITKQDYWTWLEKGYTPLPKSLSFPSKTRRILDKAIHRIVSVGSFQHPYELKDVQDGFIMSRLHDAQGKRILEVGGGKPRLLGQLSKHNECWSIDKFKGKGRGPQKAPRTPDIRIVQGYMGEFLEQIPTGYFDWVFSVSVVEHVALANIENFFADCARVLKPHGRMLHAIDTYIFDPTREDLIAPFRQRIQTYLEYADRPDLGIRLAETPQVNGNLSFSCSYASLPDNVIYEWYLNRKDDKRVFGQVVSIKSEWEKIK